MADILIRSTVVDDPILWKWQRIVDIMSEILEVPSAIITRVDPPEISVLSSAQTSDNPYHQGDKVEMAKHYCETVLLNNKRLEITYAPDDPEWNSAPELAYGVVAYLGYPLCWPEGEMFGTICVLDKKKNEFGPRFDKILNEFRDVVEAHLELLVKNEALRKTLDEVKILRGMLPICSSCKKIRDDKGYWNQIETYLRAHSDAEFTHSLCPDCVTKLYPDLHVNMR